MKFASIAVLFAGVLSTAEAASITSLAKAENQQRIEAEKGSSSDSDNELVQLNEQGVPCEYLDETQEELGYQLDMFSRTLDRRHWTNAVNVHNAIKKKTGNDLPLRVTTWELYNKAFSFPRVRRYNFVNENMDMLEHFEDNLNTNISNNVNMENFLRVANTVRRNFNEKYHDGEFDDPGNHDPRAEAEEPKTWSQL